MAYIIWNYDNLIYKMMHKTPTFAEPQQYNRPFSCGHVSVFLNKFSSINMANGMLLLRSEWKKKKSCNKNAIKNTEMLENYIYCIPIKFSNISVFFINFLWKIFHKPIVLVVLTTANFGGGFSNFCRYYTRSQTGKSTGYRPTLKWVGMFLTTNVQIVFF
jgi:hypothetical protein